MVFVHNPTGSCPTELTSTFDLTVCRVILAPDVAFGYTHADHLGDVWHRRARYTRHHEARIARLLFKFDGVRRSAEEQRLSLVNVNGPNRTPLDVAEARLAKYKARGFTIRLSVTMVV